MSQSVFCWQSINWATIIALIIAWPLAKFVLVSLYEVFKYFIPSNDLLKRYCKSEGVTWAVVTGATDGIGLGFCEVLVQMGFNVVLVSRNNEKLQATAESLKAQAERIGKTVQLKTICFDFKNSSDSSKFNDLVANLKSLDIGIFINNVGTSDVRCYHSMTHQQIVDFININCVGMAALSAEVLKVMKNRPQKSALINLSSYMEEKALPYLSLYAATKAFNHSLTEGLWHQYPHIDIMSLKPMFVQTNLSRQKKGFTIPDRRQCASHSLKELSWQHETYGHLSHRIVGAASRYLIPDWLYYFLARRLTKLFLRRSFPSAKFD